MGLWVLDSFPEAGKLQVATIFLASDLIFEAHLFLMNCTFFSAFLSWEIGESAFDTLLVFRAVTRNWFVIGIGTTRIDFVITLSVYFGFSA